MCVAILTEEINHHSRVRVNDSTYLFTAFSASQPSTELGFDFQYAEPGRAIMTLWLPTDSESRLPRGPTHQIGVGALVLHPRTGEMLAVQEKTGPAAGKFFYLISRPDSSHKG